MSISTWQCFTVKKAAATIIHDIALDSAVVMLSSRGLHCSLLCVPWSFIFLSTRSKYLYFNVTIYITFFNDLLATFIHNVNVMPLENVSDSINYHHARSYGYSCCLIDSCISLSYVVRTERTFADSSINCYISSIRCWKLNTTRTLWPAAILHVGDTTLMYLSVLWSL